MYRWSIESADQQTNTSTGKRSQPVLAGHEGELQHLKMRLFTTGLLVAHERLETED